MQATGIRDSATILQRLSNYAKPIMTIQEEGNLIESPIRQGSGIVQVKVTFFCCSLIVSLIKAIAGICRIYGLSDI